MLILRSLIFLLLASLLVISQPSLAKARATSLTCASAAGIKTEVELLPNLDIYVVNVNFIGKHPSNKEVDRVLRDCLSVAVKRDGTKDILGSPWFRKRVGDDPNDDELLHTYGHFRYLSYEAASKNIGIRELKLKKKSP